MSDSWYDVQQICLNGHQVTDCLRSSPENSKKFCDQCGAKTIDKCQNCGEPIRGYKHVFGVVSLNRKKVAVPKMCHNCGAPFPWIESLPDDNSINEGAAQIIIRPEIYNHIKQYLDSGDYFHAVEESYKIVREKLRKKTAQEKATEVFNENAQNQKYNEQLFGKLKPESEPEKDFFRGIGYLHLAVQFLRNEKAHMVATQIDKNLTIHYISLASLAYELISRSNEA